MANFQNHFDNSDLWLHNRRVLLKETFVAKKEDKKDKQEKEESSFAWKKNGFDMREHLTLKNNAIEAEAYQELAKKEKSKKTKNAEKTLPVGLQKLRKKVREVYDEDEEEDDYTYTFAPIMQMEDETEDNRLFKGLSDEEKRALKQKQTIDIVKSQQDVGKMEALHIAHNLAREAGLKGLSEKSVAQGMQEAEFRPQEMQKEIISKDVTQKLGIKGKIEDGKIIQAARGIKKVENLGGQKAAKNLDMKDVIKAGEEKLDEIKLAELILQKSGQDVKKRKTKFNQGKEKIELKHLENKDSKESKTEDKTTQKKEKLNLSSKSADFGR